MNFSINTLNRKRKTVDADLFTPAPPRVNLVPQGGLDRAANAKSRTLAVIGWGVSVVALGAWWGTGFVAAGDARDNLVDARAAGETLSVELAIYAPVTTIAAQIQSMNDTVASQTAGEVNHDEVIERFLAAVGDTMTVESLQIATDTSGACVSTDPFQQVPLAGCVTFSGTAPGGGSSASAVITALTGDTWFVDPFVPTVGSATERGTSMTGTVGLSIEAFADGPVPDDGTVPPETPTVPETEG